MKNLYYMNCKDIQSIGGRVSYDESFKPVPGVAGFFISNCGRLVSKRQNETKLCSINIYNGYEYHNTKVKKYGKYRNCDLKIHRLVAECFVDIPDWIDEKDILTLEVHHLMKVSRCAKIYGLNYATNLIWLPRSVHKVLHQHERLEVLINGTYKPYGFLDACKKLKITPYDMVEVLKHKTVSNGYNSYSATICRDDGSSIVVSVREKVAQEQKTVA